MLRIKNIFIFCVSFVLLFSELNAQSVDISKIEEETNINQKNKSGEREGLWVISQKERMGEPAQIKIGHYEDGEKMGTWYTFNKFKVLIASEQYVNGQINGSVKYYDEQGLICEGQYYGNTSKRSVDTIIVTHPITFMDTLVPVYQDEGSFKHGIWSFYNSDTKQLIKREYYQVGDLLRIEEVPLKEIVDSTYIQKRIQQLPHNQPGNKRKNKSRKSLIH